MRKVEYMEYMYIDKIENYRSIHSGDTAFILGNGPSLNDYDLSKLEGKLTITMNRSYKKFKNCTYYATLMDTYYLEETMTWKPKVYFTVGSLAEVPQKIRWNKDAAKSTMCFVKRLTKHDLPSKNFYDLVLGWRVTHTGLFAMHLAWYMGVAKMVLLGYDGLGNHFEPEYRVDNQPDFDKLRCEVHRFNGWLDNRVKIVNCFKHNTYMQQWKDYETQT